MINSSKGFTLVELSIVLVIIGLLVSGIMAGQSLIESAKTQNFIREIQQYDAMVNSFKAKFRSLPGDTDVFGGIYGNRNGFIENSYHVTGANQLEIYFGAEAGQFWNHLNIAGFESKGDFDVCFGCSLRVREHYPESVYDDTGIVVVRAEDQFLYHNNFYYLIADDPDSISKVKNTANGSLTPIQALAIDAKIDDGIARQGKVSGDSYTLFVNGGGCYDSATLAYNVDSSDTECNIMVGILDSQLR